MQTWCPRYTLTGITDILNTENLKINCGTFQGDLISILLLCLFLLNLIRLIMNIKPLKTI